MSHVVSSKVIITDFECLKRVLKKFPKLKLHEGRKTYKWWGKWENDYDAADAAYKNGIAPEDYGKCEHAISMEGSDYEIGVTKRKDGQGLSLVWDFFGTGKNISDYIGESAEKLMTEYSAEYCRQFAEQSGMMVNQSSDEEFIYMEMMQ